MLGHQQGQRLAHLFMGLEGAGIGLDHGEHYERTACQLHRHRRLRQCGGLEIAPFHRGLEFGAARHIGQRFRYRQYHQDMACRLDRSGSDFLFFFNQFR